MPKGDNLKGKRHHSWAGGIRCVRSIDEALALPDDNIEAMKRWLKRNIVEDELTGCWNWQRQMNRKGYAQINLKGTTNFAHRLAYALFKGAVGVLQVLHKCDNPACVNPDHLFLGTHDDNMRDMVKKGRSNAGDNHPRRVLSSKQVVEIKRRLKNGEKRREIALEHGVSYDAVRGIDNGKTWRTV